MTKRFARDARLVGARAAGLAMLLSLAACGGGLLGEDKPDTPAVDETPKVKTTAENAGAGIGLANCTTPSGGRIHFKIANTVLAVPGNIVTDAIPAGMAPPLTKEKVVAEVQSQFSQGIGCPGKPMDTGLLLVKEKLDHPLLEGNIGLLALPPGGITERFAKETQRLQNDPAKGCQPIPESDLIACAGKEKRGDAVIEVLYVVTTNKAEKMANGGPLAARCTREGQAIKGCNLVDQLQGGLAIDASLKSGRYTTEGLRGALDTAVGRINGLRVPSGT